MEIMIGQPPVTIKNAKLKKSNVTSVYKIITTDNKLKKATEKIRSVKDKVERKKLKANTLPYILPFKYKELIRNQKYFAHADIMAFEADDIKKSDLPKVLDKLRSDKRILLLYTSVSGTGFKMFVNLNCNVSSDYHLRLYNVLRLKFNKEFDLIFDPSSKDMARVQYLSYDVDAYFNPDATQINSKELIEHLHIYDSVPIDKQTMVDLAYGHNDIIKAIKYIRNNGYLDMSEEQLWWELSMSIASLGEGGREYFLLLSLDHPKYPEDTEVKLNKRYDKMLEAWGNYMDEDRILTMNAFFNKIEKVFKYKAPRVDISGKKSIEFMLADKFVKKYKNLLLYDHSKAGKARTYGWYIWNNKYFQLSKKGEISDYYIKFIEEEKAIAIKAAKKRKSEAEDVGLEVDRSVENKLSKTDIEDEVLTLAAVSRAESRRLRDLTLTWAGEREGLGVLPDELDSDPDLFNTQNCIYNIREGKQLAHAPEFNLTKMSGVTYQKSAKCHAWENFIMKISFNNVEIAKYIQEAVGYSMTGYTSEQCLFFLYGIGANGKSTFLEGLKLIFGDYQTHANYETFTNTSRSGSGHSEDVVRLKGSRLVVSSEINANQSLNESVIKQMTAGDTITARDLHSSSIEFKPTFKIWIAGNHKPKIQNFDKGIKRRIFIIPFEYIFDDSEIRPQHEVIDEFKAERAGIFNWALEGAERWLKNKSLTVPDAVKETTRKYFLENNVIEQFLTECCIINEYKYTGAKELYAEYLDYVLSMNEERMGRNSFYSRLEELGFKRFSSSTQQLEFKGLQLSTQKQNINQTVKENLPA